MVLKSVFLYCIKGYCSVSITWLTSCKSERKGSERGKWRNNDKILKAFNLSSSQLRNRNVIYNSTLNLWQNFHKTFWYSYFMVCFLSFFVVLFVSIMFSHPYLTLTLQCYSKPYNSFNWFAVHLWTDTWHLCFSVAETSISGLELQKFCDQYNVMATQATNPCSLARLYTVRSVGSSWHSWIW